MTIRMRDYMDRSDGWGHAEGKEVFDRLFAVIEQRPSVAVVRISLDGVEKTDASFPRESVVSLAKHYRMRKGFCLIDAHDPDLLENWEAGTKKLAQPLIVWHEHGWTLLGRELSASLNVLFGYVVARTGVTTSEVVKDLHLNSPNASNKLKMLWEEGYVLRRESVASTGGIEFEYFAVR